METSKIISDAVRSIPLEIKKEVSFKFAVSDKIDRLMKEKGMTQKELARKMGKTEAEVSVWLTGRHNFTLRTLAEISVFFEEDLIHITK